MKKEFHSGPVVFHSGPDEKYPPAVKSFSANKTASFTQLKIINIKILQMFNTMVRYVIIT